MFQGAFRVNGAISTVASVVIILAAVYMLWVYQRVFFGKPGDYDPAVAMAHASAGHGDHDDHAVTANVDSHSSSSPEASQRMFGTQHGSSTDQMAASDKHSDEEAHGSHGHHPDPDVLNNGAKFPDLNFGEIFTLYPMGILAICGGHLPGLGVGFLQPACPGLDSRL